MAAFLSLSVSFPSGVLHRSFNLCLDVLQLSDSCSLVFVSIPLAFLWLSFVVPLAVLQISFSCPLFFLWISFSVSLSFPLAFPLALLYVSSGRFPVAVC